MNDLDNLTQQLVDDSSKVDSEKNALKMKLKLIECEINDLNEQIQSKVRLRTFSFLFLFFMLHILYLMKGKSLCHHGRANHSP